MSIAKVTSPKMIKPKKAEEPPSPRGTNFSSNFQMNGSAMPISVKLPPFSCHYPRSWFRKVESIFYLAGIKKTEEMYHHIIANIDIRTIADIVHKLPENNSYDILKTELLKSADASKERSIDKYSRPKDLPSSILKDLRNLAGEMGSEEYLKKRWMEKLHSNVQKYLADLHTANLTLDELAEMADETAQPFRVPT